MYCSLLQTNSEMCHIRKYVKNKDSYYYCCCCCCCCCYYYYYYYYYYTFWQNNYTVARHRSVLYFYMAKFPQLSMCWFNCPQVS
jgi:hypothetical protein